MTAQEVKLQRLATHILFMDVLYELLLALHEYDAAKSTAKNNIIDAYSNGEIHERTAINLIREYGLETS